MPKILISTNTAWNAYNFRAGLIRGLMDAGYEVVAAAPSDSNESKLLAIGCRFVELQMDNKGTSPFGDIGLLLRYINLLRREKPDVFLGYTIKPNVYGSLAAHMLRIPVINNISGLGTAFIHDSWLTQVVKLLYRLSLRSSATVFFQNQDDRNLFVEHRLVRRPQTALLPGSGINLSKFSPQEPPDHERSAPHFLLVARLLWDKGVGEYVDAARIVRAQLPEAHFKVLGFLDAKNRSAISKQTVTEWVQEGVVDYLGAAEDVRPYIAASDCVVLPSYREGTPRTLLEAAAMGKPLIAADVPGCREVVEHGRNGFLCRVRSAADLAEKIIEFAKLTAVDRSSMGRASRTKIELEFNEQIVVRRYLEEIKRCC